MGRKAWPVLVTRVHERTVRSTSVTVRSSGSAQPCMACSVRKVSVLSACLTSHWHNSTTLSAAKSHRPMPRIKCGPAPVFSSRSGLRLKATGMPYPL